MTDEQTAFDYAVLALEDRIGEVVGYPGYRTYDECLNAHQFLSIEEARSKILR